MTQQNKTDMKKILNNILQTAEQAIGLDEDNMKDALKEIRDYTRTILKQK